MNFSFPFRPKDSCNFAEIIRVRRIWLVETAGTVSNGNARGEETRFRSRDYVRHRDRVCRPCVTDAAHLDHWTHSNRLSRDTASNYAFSKVSLQLFLLFACCPPSLCSLFFPLYIAPKKRSTTESEGRGWPDGRWKFRRNFEKFTRALDVPAIRDGRETAIKTGPKGGRAFPRVVATRTTGCNSAAEKTWKKLRLWKKRAKRREKHISCSPREKSWNFNRDLGKRLGKVQRAPTALLRVRGTPRGKPGISNEEDEDAAEGEERAAYSETNGG